MLPERALADNVPPWPDVQERPAPGEGESMITTERNLDRPPKDHVDSANAIEHSVYVQYGTPLFTVAHDPIKSVTLQVRVYPRIEG
jgi:hypothetical protein